MIELKDLKQAVLVSEHLSFRRTAATLNMHPSAISRSVRALEDQLGVSLFERHNSGVRVTTAGRWFLERARAALCELDYAVKSAMKAGQGAEGFLRIGIFSSLASLFPRLAIGAFARQNNGVDVDVAEGAPNAHIARVRERCLDIAFVTGVPSITDCDTQQFWSERVFVVLPAEHGLVGQLGVRWDELRDEHFIVSRQEPGPEIHDYVIRKLADLGHHPSVTRYDVGRENLINLVGLGFGISLTSEATVATRYPDVVFRPIEGEDDILPFSAVWSPSNDNPALRRFLALMRAMAEGRPLPATD
jgi:DNA-binding transcriptional LysR family regulator